MVSLKRVLILAALLAVCTPISLPAPTTTLEPPTMLETAIVGPDSVAYAWRNPDDACSPSTIRFYQQMLNNYTAVNITIPNGPGPLGSDVISGLTPFTNYSIEVRYICADGRMSAFSDPLMFQTLQGMPSPPTIDNIVPYPPTPFSALRINWTAPTMPNGVIECYRFTICKVDEPSICPIMNKDILATPDLSYVATGLTPDTNYSVTLMAKNGATEELRVSNPDTGFGATEHGQSSAPTNLTEMSVGPNNIMIAWTAPSMPNGMISSYRVEVFYSGQPPRVENTGNTMTSFDIMGLDPFTNYTIRVAGVNDFGTGNFSNAITVQTAEDVPSPPLNLIGVPSGATSAILQWDPPAMPNGVIIAYIVTFTGSANPPNVPQVPGGTTTVEVMGFDPGTLVSFSVSARTSAGNSTPSDPFSVQLPATDATPSAPRNLMGFPMPTSLRLMWDAPLFIGNLTHYLVRCNGSQSLTNQTNGTESTFTFENLTPESPYNCEVTAFANTTEGGMTSQSFVTTTPVLGAPMNVTATADSPTSIMVTWAHPMFMNTIDDYFIIQQTFGLPAGVANQGGSEEIVCESFNSPIFGRKRSMQPLCISFTSFIITGLEEYIHYNVSVIAANNAGDSTSGFDTALTMPAAPLGSPMNLMSPSQTYNSITLQWDGIPFLNQNGPNFQYIVFYRVYNSGDSPLNITVQADTATIPNLMSFTVYSIFVQAQNNVGMGPSSVTINVRTLAAPPGPVSNIMVMPNENGTAADITWTAAQLSDNNTEVNYMVVVRGPSGTVVFMETTSGTTVSVTQGLAPFLRYTVYIMAFTEGGNGPNTTEAFYTLEGVPSGTVTNVLVEPVAEGLRVTFDPITDPSVARGNVSYMVCYTTQTNATMVCETTQTSPAIISVPGNEVYNVTVAAFTAAGVGMSTGGVVFDARTPGPLLAGTNLVLVIVLCTVAPVALGVVVIAIIAFICIQKPK